QTPDRHNRSATTVSGRYSGLPGTSHNSNFKWTSKIHSECREHKPYMFSQWKQHSGLNGIAETTIIASGVDGILIQDHLLRILAEVNHFNSRNSKTRKSFQNSPEHAV
ncbi:hypothetical protein HAX54_042140, partial [Datura stramonium]|nr:hypothetical protein [Datura stramonium]